jgi:hypothetical protein
MNIRNLLLFLLQITTNDTGAEMSHEKMLNVNSCLLIMRGVICLNKRWEGKSGKHIEYMKNNYRGGIIFRVWINQIHPLAVSAAEDGLRHELDSLMECKLL